MSDEQPQLSWTDIWKQYWTTLPEDPEAFEEELKRNLPDITRVELVSSLRDLGTGGGFERWSPKQGAIVRFIRDKRRTENESQNKHYDRTSKCMYCDNRGWMNIHYTVVTKGDRMGIKFPSGKFVNLDAGKGKVMRVYAHELHDITAIPCMCRYGQKFDTNGGKFYIGEHEGKTWVLGFDMLRQRYSKWLFKLPDSSILKPIQISGRVDAIEGEPTEHSAENLPDAIADAPEFKQAIAEQEETQGDMWEL